MFKARNVFEAGFLVVVIGVPVLYLPFSLTARIIILCLTVLPLGILALIGISGESLSSFLLVFIKYLRNRRIIEPQKEEPELEINKFKREMNHILKLLKEKVAIFSSCIEKKCPQMVNRLKKLQENTKQRQPESKFFPFLNPVAEYLPVEKIENGIIYTKDHRYVKIVEIIPINFLLRSSREERWWNC